MRISVIIATRNRRLQLIDCLKSISRGSLKPFEVIVVDQSDVDQRIRNDYLREIKLNIKIFCQNQRGVSRARNRGVALATGEIIAFTDDDCIVDKNWIVDIDSYFRQNKKTAGLFGKVVAYKQAKKQRLFCPSITEVPIRKVIQVEQRIIGKYDWFISGSNIVVRREIATNFPFSNLLGHGSIGRGTEDLEFCYRLLKDQITIYYHPDLIIFHNKWINAYDYRMHIRYERGFVLFHIFYLLFGDRFIGKVLTNHLRRVLLNQYHNISDSIIHFHPRALFWETYFSFEYLLSWLSGFYLGIYFRVLSKRSDLSGLNKVLL